MHKKSPNQVVHKDAEGKVRLRRALVLICVAMVATASLIAFARVKVPSSASIDQIPDEGLRNQILQGADVNHDGKLSEGEANEVTSLVVTDADTVSNLDIFPALRTLIVRGSKVTSVDVTNMQGLKRLDVSGAQNLKTLTVKSALNLQWIDLRGTSVESFDLSQAGHPTTVIADPGVELIGLETGTAERQLLTHFEQSSQSDPSKTFTVDAEYDDTGKMVTRTLAGAVNAKLSYSYEQNDELKSVEIKSDSTPELSNAWTLKFTPGSIDAMGKDGTFVNRKYEGQGKLTSVDINTIGVKGPIVCTMSLSYDARGYLSGVSLDDGGKHTDYLVVCNGAASIETVSSADAMYYWNGGSDIVSGWLTSGEASIHSTASKGGFSANATRLEDGATTREVGKYGYTYDQGARTSHFWGRQVNIDGTDVTSYDGDNETYSVASTSWQNPSAVFMRDKTNPSYVTGYWLLDDAESAVRVAMLEAESRQWSIGSTDPIVDEVDEKRYAAEVKKYEDVLSNVAEELGIDNGQILYAFFKSGEETLPMMAVTTASRQDSALAVYAIEDGEPIAVAKADNGRLCVCGGGFFKITNDVDRDVVLHFNGASMDRIAWVEDGSYTNYKLGIGDRAADASDIESLDSGYPSAMGTVTWKKLQ